MSNQISMINNFLAWLYGEDALLKSPVGIPYPVTVKPCILDNPEAVLQELTEDTRQFPNSSPLLEEMKQKNQHLWNGRTYVFLGLDTASPYPRLRCGSGYYFDMVNTCMMLEQELTRTISQTPELDFAALYERMPLRRALHQNQTGEAALQDVWTGVHRSATLAISCLFAAYSGKSYRYYVSRRSAQVADGAGLYHIIPSMVFQPINSDKQPQNSFNITNTILREVAEELFNHPENTPTDYPEIATLRELLETGGAELVVTGVAMDLLNLQPEILATFVIHDQTWLQQYQHQIRFSRDEYVTDADESKSYRNLEDDSILQPGGEFAPENCVVVGAACLIVGLPVARQLGDRYCENPTEA